MFGRHRGGVRNRSKICGMWVGMVTDGAVSSPPVPRPKRYETNSEEMQVVIRQQKDFWSGVMFFALGVLFIIWSREYQFGTSQRMGPGYFPTILGWLMAVLGILVNVGLIGYEIVSSLRVGGKLIAAQLVLVTRR